MASRSASAPGSARAHVRVEAPHQLRGRGVGDAPQGHGHGVRARVQERPREAHHALAGHDLAEPGVARREGHEPRPQRQGRDLPDVQEPVLAVPRREDERRAARGAVVVRPVGREVQGAVATELGALQPALGRLRSLPHVGRARREESGDRLRLSAGQGQRAERLGRGRRVGQQPDRGGGARGASRAQRAGHRGRGGVAHHVALQDQPAALVLESLERDEVEDPIARDHEARQCFEPGGHGETGASRAAVPPRRGPRPRTARPTRSASARRAPRARSPSGREGPPSGTRRA